MGHKVTMKKKLQKISTLLNSDACISTNLSRTTSLQLTYQLTNIPSTRLLFEKEFALRLKSLLMQLHKKTHALLLSIDHFQNGKSRDIVIFTDGSAQTYGSGCGYAVMEPTKSDPFVAIYISLPKLTTKLC